MMNINVRHSTLEDIDFLWDMLYEAIYIPEGEQKPPRDILKEPGIAKILDNWGRTGDLALIATDNENNRLGAVWVRLYSISSNMYGFIDESTPILGTALVQDFRGKGIGTVLLEEILKTSKERGFKSISLSVDPNNPARRLYERLGFKKVGEAGTSWDMVVDF